MTTLSPYKGFQGDVEYDDGVLLIRILHIHDSISTTCRSSEDVVSAFHELVDDYIETCKELSEEPNRPFKGSFNVRVTPDLHRSAAMVAAVKEMTLNSWVEMAIEEKLQRERGDHGYPFEDAAIIYRSHSTITAVGAWVARTDPHTLGEPVVDLIKYAQAKKNAGSKP